MFIFKPHLIYCPSVFCLSTVPFLPPPSLHSSLSSNHLLNNHASILPFGTNVSIALLILFPVPSISTITPRNVPHSHFHFFAFTFLPTGFALFFPCIHLLLTVCLNAFPNDSFCIISITNVLSPVFLASHILPYLYRFSLFIFSFPILILCINSFLEANQHFIETKLFLNLTHIIGISFICIFINFCKSSWETHAIFLLYRHYLTYKL